MFIAMKTELEKIVKMLKFIILSNFVICKDKGPLLSIAAQAKGMQRTWKGGVKATARP